MPNGNNLMAGRASVGVSDDTRPQYGLPFSRLPGAAQTTVTPELRLKREIKMGQKQIWDRFTLQWNEMNNSRRFVGVGKVQRMQQELHTKAKQDMLAFGQKARMQMDQLRNIDRLAEQGMVDQEKADYLKAYQVYGPQTARAMHPEPEKERTIPQQIDTLDLHAYKIEDRLAQFRTVERGPWDEKLLARKTWFGWPFPKEKKKLITQVYDRTISGEDEEGELTMGGWRPATEEEIRGQKLGEEQLKDLKQRVRGLREKYFEQPDVSRRIVPTGVKGGGFDTGVTESMRGPVKRPRRSRQLEVRDPLGLRP